MVDTGFPSTVGWGCRGPRCDGGERRGGREGNEQKLLWGRPVTEKVLALYKHLDVYLSGKVPEIMAMEYCAAPDT